MAPNLEDHHPQNQNPTLQTFIPYVQAQGIQVHHSIEPYHFLRHGSGIRAVSALEAIPGHQVDSCLVCVPRSALLTPSSIPEGFCAKSARKSISVHALLAAYIAFDEVFTSRNGLYTAWEATWPVYENFRASMPLLWPPRCQGRWSPPSNETPHFNTQSSLHSPRTDHDVRYQDDAFSVLPTGITNLLETQAARFRQDLETALSIIPSAKDAYRQSSLCAKENFKYAWCIVNTRCLYFDPSPPQRGHRSPPRQHDNKVLADEVETLAPQNQLQDTNQFMVLCPLIDLFNHTSNPTSACKVTHDSSGFTVTSPSVPTGTKGEEELFVSYGSHPNDFLFVEYGFVLPGSENIHDCVSIDSVILRTLSLEQKRRLGAKGYLGEYTLFSPQANGGEARVCWRTEVAARIGLLSVQQWEGFVDGILDEDELADEVKEKARATIRTWVETGRQHAEKSVRGLERLARDPTEIQKLFGDDLESSDPADAKRTSSTHQPADQTEIVQRETEIARRRCDLVLERWRQILHICDAYLHHDQA